MPTIPERLETVTTQLETAASSIETAVQIQSDIISGGINDVVNTPGGNIRTVANAVNEMSLINPTGAWLPSTQYFAKDLVDYLGLTYICVLGHTSDAADFNVDLTAGKWVLYQVTNLQDYHKILGVANLSKKTHIVTGLAGYINSDFFYSNSSNYVFENGALQTGKVFLSLEADIQSDVASGIDIYANIQTRDEGTIFDGFAAGVVDTNSAGVNANELYKVEMDMTQGNATNWDWVTNPIPGVNTSGSLSNWYVISIKITVSNPLVHFLSTDIVVYR